MSKICEVLKVTEMKWGRCVWKDLVYVSGKCCLIVKQKKRWETVLHLGLKSHTAFEHAGKKKKMPYSLVGLKWERDIWKWPYHHLRLTSVPAAKSNIVACSTFRKICLIHQTSHLRLHDHGDKTHCICSTLRMKLTAMHKSHKGKKSQIVPLI